jgi:hypothetical protein
VLPLLSVVREVVSRPHARLLFPRQTSRWWRERLQTSHMIVFHFHMGLQWSREQVGIFKFRRPVSIKSSRLFKYSVVETEE